MGSWPSVGFEEYPWSVDTRAHASRAARRRHVGPYRAAVVPEIASLDVRLPSDTVAAAEDAVAALVRFDAEVGRDIAAFSSVLLRSESAASSKIEQLSASARAIAESELAPSGRSNASLIVANAAAMNTAVAAAKRLDADAILATHAALLGVSAPQIAGRWREQQVWIGGHDLGPHEAMFVPPHHRHVVAAIDDLAQYIDRDDVAVLPHVAIAHAHFETIHPFPDGNGRTGRALVHAQLRAKGAVRDLTVPISAGLLTDTRTYFDALDAYREGDPEPIVVRMIEATFTAITLGRGLADALISIRGGWSEALVARRDSAAWRALDVFVRRPVVDATLLAAELGVRVQNVYRAVAPLIEAGIVVESTDQKRNRRWRAPEVLAALDDFAAGSGRRARH